MITIIVGTNRALAFSEKVANIYSNILHTMNIEHQTLNLSQLDSLYRNDTMIRIEEKYLKSIEKFIFVLPEYNGSFPGIFKLFLDNSNIREVWNYKKVALVGVADGRAGNIRGLDHATTLLHYMKVDVFYNKVYFSQVKKIIEDDSILDDRIEEEMKSQLISFVNY